METENLDFFLSVVFIVPSQCGDTFLLGVLKVRGLFSVTIAGVVLMSRG